MAYLGFDASTVAPATEFTALPSGEYLMAITESEMKDTKKGGNGQYLQLTLQVLQAAIQEHINRKVFVRLNLINDNQTAVEIAQRELSAICHAVGVLKLQDSQQLHDLPMCCKVQYVPAKGEFSESNKIAAYKPASEYGKGKAGLAGVPPRPGVLTPQPPRPVAPPAAAIPAPSAPAVVAPAPTQTPAPGVPKVAPWRQNAAA